MRRLPIPRNPECSGNPHDDEGSHEQCKRLVERLECIADLVHVVFCAAEDRGDALISAPKARSGRTPRGRPVQSLGALNGSESFVRAIVEHGHADFPVEPVAWLIDHCLKLNMQREEIS